MQFLLSSLSLFFPKHLFVFSKPFEQKHNLCHFGCCIWCFGIFVVLAGTLGWRVDMWKTAQFEMCWLQQRFLWQQTHGICFWFVWVAGQCCHISLPASSRWTTGICWQPKQGHNREGPSNEWSFLFCCTVKLLNLTNWWIWAIKIYFPGLYLVSRACLLVDSLLNQLLFTSFLCRPH